MKTSTIVWVVVVVALVAAGYYMFRSTPTEAPAVEDNAPAAQDASDNAANVVGATEDSSATAAEETNDAAGAVDETDGATQ